MVGKVCKEIMSTMASSALRNPQYFLYLTATRVVSFVRLHPEERAAPVASGRNSKWSETNESGQLNCLDKLFGLPYVLCLRSL